MRKTGSPPPGAGGQERRPSEGHSDTRQGSPEGHSAAQERPLGTVVLTAFRGEPRGR